MRVFLAFFVFCLALVMTSVSGAHLSYRMYPKINEVSSWLALRDVEVHCLTQEEAFLDPVISFWGADAYVPGVYDKNRKWSPGDYAIFNNGLCEQLIKPTNVPDLAWSILVLTHESGHLRNKSWSASEAKTECWAIRHIKPVIRKFGYTDPQVVNLLLAYAVYWHKGMSKQYKSKGCHIPEVSPINFFPPLNP